MGGFGAIGMERKVSKKTERNILGHDIYRETPGKLKIILTSNTAGKLIGTGGETIKKLRKKYKNTEINVTRNHPRYVELSGEKLLDIYFEVMGII